MLTETHARTLSENPSPTVRANVATAVAADYAAGELTGTEAQIAEQILDMLARDVEARVRHAVVEQVKECPFLPSQIASALAHDFENSVALPIIEHSPLLRNDELIALVRGGDLARQLAVARRNFIAEPVAEELAERGNSEVVTVVLSNEGADLSEKSLFTIAVRFPGDEQAATLMIERPALPLSVCEFLIRRVSKELRSRLMFQHHLPEFMANELVAQGQDKALTELLPFDRMETGERLAARLHANDMLTPMLVLRTLCNGDLSFFEGAMDVLAGIPAGHAASLLYDPDVSGLRGIYARAGLPPALFGAFRIAVNAVTDGRLKQGRQAYTQHIVDQLVRHYRDLAPSSIEQMLAQLGHRTQTDNDVSF